MTRHGRYRRHGYDLVKRYQRWGEQYRGAFVAPTNDAGDWHDQRARREAYDATPTDTDAVPF